MMKEIVIFGSGCVIGAAVGSFVTYHKIVKREQARADAKIESHKKYTEWLESQVKSNNIALRNGYISEDDESSPGESSESGVVIGNEVDKATGGEIRGDSKKKKGEGFKAPVRDYTSYFKHRAESEYPREEDDHVRDDVIDSVAHDNEMIKESIESGKEPTIVSESEFWSPSYEFHDKVTLNYYIEDDVLATEDDDVIENRILHVGNCLTKNGFATNDEKGIYVRNYELAVDYEIDKIYGAYAEMYDKLN